MRFFSLRRRQPRKPDDKRWQAPGQTGPVNTEPSANRQAAASTGKPTQSRGRKFRNIAVLTSALGAAWFGGSRVAEHRRWQADYGQTLGRVTEADWARRSADLHCMTLPEAKLLTTRLVRGGYQPLSLEELDILYAFIGTRAVHNGAKLKKVAEWKNSE